MNSSINAFSCLVQALPFRRLSNGFKCSVYRFTLVQSKLELYLLWLQENIFFSLTYKTQPVIHMKMVKKQVITQLPGLLRWLNEVQENP